ncbi:MAG: hypothetical protein FWC89_00585 [Defluviitaleaceae bacterium]|nr:hypothetical protein [Defluviitaleaceae bacterium]
MRNTDYWQQRFEAIEEMTTTTGENHIQSMERIFSNAQMDLQNQISGWYNRFATNNQIDLAEARRLLNANELAEFRWTVEEYIDYAKQNTVSGQWIRQLETHPHGCIFPALKPCNSRPSTRWSGYLAIS